VQTELWMIMGSVESTMRAGLVLASSINREMMLERQSESTIDIAPHSSQRLHMVLCPLGPAAQATRSLGI
jgi:hypothetical protein